MSGRRNVRIGIRSGIGSAIGSAIGNGAAALAVAVVLVATACVPPTNTPTHIGPHQRFSGLVNGSRSGAIVTTVCPGPVTVGRMGHPVAGQTVSVTSDPNGAGDTGSDSSTVFAQTGSSYNVVQIGIYDTPETIPTDVSVPCDGPGTVTFLQCFGIIACRDGSPDVVKVTFVNIAD